MQGVSFLVAEDDPGVGRVLRRALAPYGRAVLVTSVRAAEAALDQGGITALVADVGLPDGSGLALVAAARRRNPRLDALLVSGEVDGERLAEAHAIGAHYLLKPIDLAHLGVFAERVREGRATRARARRERTDRGVDTWSARYGLTGAEEALLRLAAHGAPRRRLAALRSVAPSTVKKQVQNLLGKTGDATLDVAVARLLRGTLETR